MQSGVTGINALRVYNPVKQGMEHDPTGAFTRRWVPELAPVPDLWLQEPWKWPGAAGFLGRRYPEPLVDVATAARAARDAVHAVRRAPGHGAAAAAVLARHASPADGSGRFVRDPVGRRAKRVPEGQLRFEF